MTAVVGIIANPASGKDIRRLVAHGSVFDNREKINIIRRAIRGLEAIGVERVVAMPDIFGLVVQAIDGMSLRIPVDLLDMPVTNQAEDSTEAARRMDRMHIGCIITLGGDGTNRAVAKGCGYTPLVPVSTGTNNAFPVMVEGTLAGLAAGAVALNVNGVRQAAVRMARRLEVWQGDQMVDMALVDAVVYAERFTGSRAIWDVEKIRTVVLSQVKAGTIGASAIAGYLPHQPPAGSRGIRLEVGPGDQQVLVPLAPGLLTAVPIAKMEWLSVGDRFTLDHAPAVLALDGERELSILPDRPLDIRLSQEGPHVVDIQAALEAAARAGVFVRQARQA